MKYISREYRGGVLCAAVLVLAGAGSPAHADYASTVLANGPVAYWRLGETTPPPAADIAVNLGSVGSAGDGFYLGNTYHPITGALVASTDSAAEFDGLSGTFVSVPNLPELNPAGPFTVECWVYPNIAMAGTDVVSPLASLRRVDTDASGWIFYQGAANWNFRMGNTEGYKINVNSSAAPVVSAWQHLAAVFDGTDARFYVNGVEQASASFGGVYTPNLRLPLGIGARGDNAFLFNGRVDEVALYGEALEAADIAAHFENGVSASPAKPYSDLVLEKNPLGYWRLNEPPYNPPVSLPVADNLGSLGESGDGSYHPGSIPGAAGPQAPQFGGFDADNRACQFNGVVGHVSTMLYDLFARPTFTMIGWFQAEGTQPNRTGLFGQNDVIEFGWHDAATQFGPWTAAGGFPVVDPTTISGGEWHFFAAVADGTNFKVIFDGVEAASVASAPTSYGTSAYYFNIGGGGILDAAGNYFKGSIDEVALFDKPLTDEQIEAIYFSAGVAPFITQQPQAPTGDIFEGNTVTLTVEARGTPTLEYQWRKDGENLEGQTAVVLELTDATLADSGLYDVVIRNDYGSATSVAVQITIQPGEAPSITVQPQPSTRFVGGAAAFTVEAVGTTPFSYQWQLDGADLTGATAATLELGDLSTADAGLYRVIVKNAFDPVGVTSEEVRLTVITPTGFAAAALADGPIAYWRLGETEGSVANDAWGAYDGVYENVTLGQPGHSALDPDPAALFSPGVASKVVVADAADFDFSGAAPSFTLEAWVKFNTTTGIQRVFANGQPGALGYGFGINGSDRLRFTTYGVQDMDSVQFQPALVPGKWYHLVAVIEEGVTYMYVNGVLIDGIVWAAAGRPSPDLPFQISGNPAGAAELVDGVIDEAVVYNTALLTERVEAHYLARYGANTRPIFTLQPQSITVYDGRPAMFTAAAEGTEPIGYQWKVNGVNVPGEILESFQTTRTPGTYTIGCTASSSAGSTDSDEATLTVLALPTSAAVVQDLVLHLKFDGDYLDSSGRDNHGTPMGAPGFVAGKIGPQALHYNTDTASSAFNYVTLGTPTDLDFGTDVNFSVAFWVKFVGAPGDLPFLANNDGSMGDVGVTIAPSYNQGGWSWGLNDALSPRAWPGIGLYDPVQNTLNDGVWHHLVHTFHRAGMGTTYLDGVKVHAMSITSAAGWTLTTGKPWNIGQASGTYAETAEADLDDLGIWRRELTPLEVDTIYLVGQNLGESFAPAMVTITVEWVDAQLELSWPAGTLESADEVTGEWTPMEVPSPHKVTPDAAKKFFRVKL